MRKLRPQTIYYKIRSYILYLYRLLTRRIYIYTGKFNISYYLDSTSALDAHIKKYGYLDDWDLLRFIKPYISQESTVFDVGANSGMVSLLLAKNIATKGVVYSFEPDNEMWERLTKNISLNKHLNIIPIKKAVTNDHNASDITLYKRSSIDGSGYINNGLASTKVISLHTKGSYQVQACSIDKEVEFLKLDRLDFIKIDVEGAEMSVILGGEKSIIKFKPIVQYEYSKTLNDLTNEHGASWVFNWFKELGYCQYTLLNGTLVRLHSVVEILRDVNVLCVPKENRFNIWFDTEYKLIYFDNVSLSRV